MNSLAHRPYLAKSSGKGIVQLDNAWFMSSEFGYFCSVEMKGQCRQSCVFDAVCTVLTKNIENEKHFKIIHQRIGG
jgi:hypothetical protein